MIQKKLQTTKPELIQPYEFRTIREVRLNKDGKIVGKMVAYKHKIYYYTYRKPIHFFIKYRAFGISKEIIRKLTIPTGKEENCVFEACEGIIIFYDGEVEKRYYVSSPYDWLQKGIEYGTDKEDDIQNYGEQFLLQQNQMRLLGVAIGDRSLRDDENDE